ncbi:staphylococcal nuclease domain-containing protein [Anaeramoeba flamelloides]|uniref:Staphylococcal nuclease domain-containing protein n=1 Tax=Anaeramoeba flamelloides TaxID=1746091 RepID=A0ABQ8Z941_9EUKA|nr:staphylococcal nuclease domain-containing protein [Anaeramoeba flamelloides]
MSKPRIGIVKKVLSGNVLLLRNRNNEEKEITLSKVITPRLSYRGNPDEPFAWDSREFLRKMVIGEKVKFIVENTIVGYRGNREFGQVIYQDKNLAVEILKAGWGSLKRNEKKKFDEEEELTEFEKQLVEAEEEAKESKIGIWTQNKKKQQESIRKIETSAPKETLLKTKKFKGIVEYVKDGSTVRLILLPNFYQIVMYLAGVQSPGFKREVIQQEANDSDDSDEGSDDDSDEDEEEKEKKKKTKEIVRWVPQPYAEDAKMFTENKLLGREVQVTLDGQDKYGIYYGTLLWKNKNIAEFLLKEGLAKVIKWTISTPSYYHNLRKFEKICQKKRKNIWKNWKPSPELEELEEKQAKWWGPHRPREFEGTIVEIVNSETVIVRTKIIQKQQTKKKTKSKEKFVEVDRRISLSNIRVPRVKRNEVVPFAFEAKELLRKHAIGKRVKVYVDYVMEIKPKKNLQQETTEKKETKGKKEENLMIECATITVGDLNLTSMLLQNGYGDVFTKKEITTDNSQYLSTYMRISTKAKKQRKGQYNKKYKPSRINDMTRQNRKKSTNFLKFMQKSQKMSAVVDYVLSGTRAILYIPKEFCLLTFSLSCIKSVRREHGLSDEVMRFTKDQIMNRDVLVSFESVDKRGTFLGTIFVNGKNLSVELLKRGYAEVLDFLARKSEFSDVFFKAQEYAQANALGIWSEKYYQEPEEDENEDEESYMDTLDKPITEIIDTRMSITVIKSLSHIFVQDQRRKGELEKVNNYLEQFNRGLKQKEPIDTAKIKKNLYCVAKFPHDKNLYRVKTLFVDKKKNQCGVKYIDYGNEDIIKFSEIWEYDQKEIQKITPLASVASLAFLNLPPEDNEFYQDASQLLYTLTYEKDLAARIVREKDSQGKMNIILIDDTKDVDEDDEDEDDEEEEEAIDINEEMVKNGLAKINAPKSELTQINEYINNLYELEKEALDNNLGIYQYGNVYREDFSKDED